MSKVKIEGHGTGTGTFTVTTPSSNTDRTITLPDATGTLLTADGDGSSLTGVVPSAGGTMTGNLVVSADIDMTGVLNGTSGSMDIKNEANGENIYIKTTSSGSEVTALKIHSGGTIELGAGQGLRVGGTAAANTLDDYEEGSYTVSISGSSSGSFSMAGNDTLAYTKIGRLVTIQGYIGAQSGSVGGNVRMSLPFAPTNLGVDDQTYNFPSVMIQNTGNTNSGQKYLFLQADGSAYLYKVADDGSASYISNSSVDGNFEIGVSFTYISG